MGQETRRPLLINICFLLALCFLAIAMRWSDLTIPDRGARGIEATYHAIWTGKILTETPFSSHLGLPAVTLNPVPGQPVLWGSTQPTPEGSMIYTSFPPLGFYPIAALEQFVGPIGTQDITIFGLFLAVTTALLAGKLAQDSFVYGQNKNHQIPTSLPNAIFWVFAFAYTLTPETIVSQGVVYWPHSVSQISIAVALIGVVRYFAADDTKNKNRWFSIIVAGCAVTTMLEWSGFLLFLGVGIVFLVDCKQNKTYKQSLRYFSILTTAGIVCLYTIVVHFCLGITCKAFFELSAQRSVARSFSFENKEMIFIVGAYAKSMGGILLAGVISTLFIIYFHKNLNRVYFYTATVSTILMLENVFLLQHAMEFPFDRMKTFFVLSIICVGAIALHQKLQRSILIGIVATCAIYTFGIGVDRNKFSTWPSIAKKNQETAEIYIQDPRYNCAILTSSGKVRGYLNLLFKKDIHEWTSRSNSEALLSKSSACAVLLVNGTTIFTDLFQLEDAEWIMPK